MQNKSLFVWIYKGPAQLPLIRPTTTCINWNMELVHTVYHIEKKINQREEKRRSALIRRDSIHFNIILFVSVSHWEFLRKYRRAISHRNKAHPWIIFNALSCVVFSDGALNVKYVLFYCTRCVSLYNGTLRTFIY